MSTAHLLVVEDDEPTRSAVAGNLAAHGYLVAEADDGEAALRRWEAARPDLIILDLGLPDTDGVTIIRRVRRDATTPILILSARGDERDKIAALEAGADDYVTKPFGLGERQARVSAIVRLSGGAAGGTTGRHARGPGGVELRRPEGRVAGRHGTQRQRQ